MAKGVYCLVLSARETQIKVGALGLLTVPPGWYVYVGSALGPGGLSRAARHIRFARAPSRSPRWHIDYLLTSPAFTLRSVVCNRTQEAAECRLAGTLQGKSIPGFGCSDCSCTSHLFSYESDPVSAITHACRSLGLYPDIKTLNTYKDQS
jgi:Uri superfamily endonuclease